MTYLYEGRGRALCFTGRVQRKESRSRIRWLRRPSEHWTKPNDVIKARKLSTPAELFDLYATFIPSSKFSKLHLHS